MNCGEEVSCGFVVAGCDGPELFEFGEEVFDQVARLVEVFVEIPGRLAVGFRWDDGGSACRSQWFKDTSVGVEGLVGDQDIGLHLGQEVIRADQVRHLPCGEEEADRVAQCVDESVDLGT